MAFEARIFATGFVAVNIHFLKCIEFAQGPFSIFIKFIPNEPSKNTSFLTIYAFSKDL